MPKSSDACFDLRYNNEGTSETMTQDGEGYFVAFRPYNGYKLGDIELLKWGKDIDNDKYKVSFSHKKDDYTDALLLTFTVENKQQKRLYLDLGVFADSCFQDNDNATVRLSNDNRAIIVNNTQLSTSHLLLIKGTYYPDVDSIYFGDYQNPEARDPKYYPYFESNTTATTTDHDSVYAFSWKYHSIKAKSSKVFGFIANPGSKLNMPPFIYDQNDPDKVYKHNRNYGLEFVVVEHDAGELVTVFFNLNGTESSETFTSTETSKYGFFRKTINLGDSFFYEYSAWAVDSTGYKSKNLTGRIIADGAAVPILEFTKKPRDEYELSETISVRGIIRDENEANLFYRFDEGEDIYSQNVIIYYEGYREFEDFINIPDYVKTGMEHTIHFWCVDDNGLKSNITSFKFFFKKPNEPHIYKAFISDERAQKGDQIVIVFEAIDKDEGQRITFYVSWDQGKTDILAQVQSTGDLTPHAFFYDIPNDAQPGRHVITLEAMDQKGISAKEKIDMYIVIYDPKNPPVSRPGNITEVDVIENSNACFNLKYTDAGGNDHEMSSRNEGFYVGYRVYDDKIPGETKLIKSKEGQQSQTGDIKIKYFSQYEPYTGFFQALFNITNDDYFPKTIDLGVFVDSELGNQHDIVRIRSDGRGITVSNDDPYVHYTVFMRSFGTLPDVTSSYLREVERQPGKEIPASEIPFWNISYESESLGNAMYSFNWRKAEIPPGETILYGVTFAPNDAMKTQPRIRDITRHEDWYSKNQYVTLVFQIDDADVGETITVYADLNGTIEEKSITITSKDTISQKVEFKVNTKRGPFIDYSVWAVDSEKFLSNTVKGRLPVSRRPMLYLSTVNMKRKFIVGENITLRGEVMDESIAFIKYKFDNGRTLIATKVDAADAYEIDEWEKFKCEIPFPPQIKPGKHKLYVWATDDYGVSEMSAEEVDIVLKPYTPPVLHKAGLSKKIAKAGEKLLGYVSFDDPDTEDYISVKVYIPTKEYFDYVGYVKKTSERKPYAFYWTVPAYTDPGNYDITIALEDNDYLKSNNITRTLIVQ